jgi:hypothetical protein
MPNLTSDALPYARLQEAFPPVRRQQIRRVIDRCRADLKAKNSPTVGAQITWKRATAVEMALDGADLPTVAAASALTEARVRQVLDNVLNWGLEALYPRFPEKMWLEKEAQEQLWKKLKPKVYSLELKWESDDNSSVSVGEEEGHERWRPSTLTDYVVREGLMDDASIPQIAAFVSRFDRKGWKIPAVHVGALSIGRKLSFTYEEPEHKSSRTRLPVQTEILVLFLASLLADAVLIYLAWKSREIRDIAFAVVFVLALFFTVLKGYQQSLAWWLQQKVLAATREGDVPASQLLGLWFRRDILRRVEPGKAIPRFTLRKMQKRACKLLKKGKELPAPASVQAPAPPGTNAAHTLGAPRIRIEHVDSLPAATWNIDHLSDSANAAGEVPLRTLYLWVFDIQDSQGGMEVHGWPQLGPVHLLLNSSALSLRDLLVNRKHLLLKDGAAVDQRMTAWRDHSGEYLRPSLFGDMGLIAREKYRGYPIHTTVCADRSWKHALHAMAKRCDVAVVNLSGYDPSHPGLEYEIRHLLSGGPPQKFLFIYDSLTDGDAAIDSVLNVWFSLEMPPATPPELFFLRCPDMADNKYFRQFGPKPRSPRSQKISKVVDKLMGNFDPIAGRAMTWLRSFEAQPLAEAEELVLGD